MKKLRGQIELRTLGVIIAAVIVVVVVVTLLTVISTFSAIPMLESKGYTIIAKADYDELNAKLDAIKVSADLAVANADAAVIAAETAVDVAQLAANKVDLFNTAERYVYPYATNITCTLTAGNTNVWSDWAQITDSGGGNLTSVFSANTGYITDCQIFDHSAVDKIYLVEISYGAAKNIIGRVAYHTSFSDTVDIKSELIPVGETVYYRMMSSGANGATARVGFRYIYE